MFIKNIAIKKYRHLEDISLGPFLRPTNLSDLVVLAGPNGGGKTSILELISLAISSAWSLTYKLNRSAPSSAFEVTLGLLPSELELIRADQIQHENESLEGAYQYLLERGEYCRSFQFPKGEYDKDPALHNSIHNIVQRCIKGAYARSLGFYLGADRSFQSKPFLNTNIFNHSTYSSPQHTWSFAFQEPSAQYEDMLNFLITWRFFYTKKLGQFFLDLEAGEATIKNRPSDEYGEILDKVFPGYRFVDGPGDSPTDLFVKLPSGDTVPFSALSSGEKEVFFLLCFYQRHSVEEAIIVIDEPEMHLHPSLARILLKAMQEMKPRNQIWLATQSSEVIDHAGRDRVFFVRRNEHHLAEIIPSTDEDQSLQCLRDFFGYSGYLGLARAMVFTEGRNASADRKLFSMISSAASRELKFIPAGGSSEVEKINRAVLSIIEAEVGWCEFYLIRDRDYLSDQMLAERRTKSSARLSILERHELENYLIQFDIISQVLDEIFNQRKSPGEVKESLHACAIEMSGNVLRDMVAFRLNALFQREDFSIPPLMQGQLQFDLENWKIDELNGLKASLEAKTQTVVDTLNDQIGKVEFDSIFSECQAEIEGCLKSDRWIDIFPGKELLSTFSKKHKIGAEPVLNNLIIKGMSHNQDMIPKELKELFDRFAS